MTYADSRAGKLGDGILQQTLFSVTVAMLHKGLQSGSQG